ncbi:MAG: LytR/AlgR family response regulator transcription factor [Wenzhouxiangella sp.]
MKAGLKVLVVDDEAPAVRRLERLLAARTDAEFVGAAHSGEQALDACRRLRPDVVLMDVEMPGLDGVEAARRLQGQARPPAIIFVTAFERYAVDAFDVQALDYLVKPVRSERLDQALARAAARLQALQAPATLSARLGERLLAIPLADVRLLQAEDKYTCVHYLGGEALIEDSLLSLEDRFGDRFVRIHRSALVSRRHLRALFRDEQGHDRVEIDDCPVRPEVSRRNLSAVRHTLKGQ